MVKINVERMVQAHRELGAVGVRRVEGVLIGAGAIPP